MDTITLKVNGMTCSGCVNSVTRILQATNGVKQVKVSLETGEALVEFDPARTGPGQLKQAIDDAGYEAA